MPGRSARERESGSRGTGHRPWRASRLSFSLAPAASAQSRRPVDSSTTPQPPSELTAGGLVWIPRRTVHAQVRARRPRRPGPRDPVRLTDRLLSSFDADPPCPSGSGAAPLWAGSSPRRRATSTSSPICAERGLLLDRFPQAAPPARVGMALRLPVIPSPRPTSISRDGRTIVSEFPYGPTDTVQIRVHDPSTGQPLRTYLHPGYILFGTFDLSPDGAVCAFGDRDGQHTTEVYETATGVHLASLPGGIRGDQALSDGGSVPRPSWDRSETYEVRSTAAVPASRCRSSTCRCRRASSAGRRERRRDDAGRELVGFERAPPGDRPRRPRDRDDDDGHVDTGTTTTSFPRPSRSPPTDRASRSGCGATRRP